MTDTKIEIIPKEEPMEECLDTRSEIEIIEIQKIAAGEYSYATLDSDDRASCRTFLIDNYGKISLINPALCWRMHAYAAANQVNRAIGKRYAQQVNLIIKRNKQRIPVQLLSKFLHTMDVDLFKDYMFYDKMFHVHQYHTGFNVSRLYSVIADRQDEWPLLFKSFYIEQLVDHKPTDYKKKVKDALSYTWQLVTIPYRIVAQVWSTLSRAKKIQVSLIIAGVVTMMTVLFGVLKIAISFLKKRKRTDETTETRILAANFIIISNLFTCCRSSLTHDSIKSYANFLVRKARNPIVLIKLVISLVTCGMAFGKVNVKNIKAKVKMFFISMKSEDCRGVEFDDDLKLNILNSEQNVFIDYKVYIKDLYPHFYDSKTRCLKLSELKFDQALIDDPVSEPYLIDELGENVIDVELLEGMVTPVPKCFCFELWHDLGGEVRFLIITSIFVAMFYMVTYFIIDHVHDSDCVCFDHSCEKDACPICLTRKNGYDCGFRSCKCSDSDVKLKKVGDEYKIQYPVKIDESILPEIPWEDDFWYEKYVGDWAEEDQLFDDHNKERSEEREMALEEMYINLYGETTDVVIYCEPQYQYYVPKMLEALRSEGKTGSYFLGSLDSDVVKNTFEANKIAKAENFALCKLGKRKAKEYKRQMNVKITEFRNKVQQRDSLKMKEKIVDETILSDADGRKETVPTKLARSRVSIRKEGLHKGGGFMAMGQIVTAKHILSAHYPNFDVGDEIEVLLGGEKKALAKVSKISELDMVALTLCKKDGDGVPVAQPKSHKLVKETPRKNISVTLFYENSRGEENLSSGRLGSTSGSQLMHNISTESGASGEAIFSHENGNPIVGMHRQGGSDYNYGIPSSIVYSFLVQGTQASLPSLGGEA